MGLTQAKHKTPILAGRRLALLICNGSFTLDYDELHRHAIDAKRYDEGVKELASAIYNSQKPDWQRDALT